MFNNSSIIPGALASSDGMFDRQLTCLLWHLRNKTVSFDQAQEACAMYSLIEMTTAGKVMYWITGTFILITNVAILWGIIGTRKLHKARFFYLANLAVADILAGVGLLCRTVDGVGVEGGLSGLYALMNILTLLIHSQIMSASALALLSVDAYVAVRHPIYFFTHAHNAKRNAGITIVSSWVVLSILAFSPSMGWNCLDMPLSECYHFFSQPYSVLVITIMSLFTSIMIFTNASVYMVIKKRQKNRIGQPGQGQSVQGNNPAQNVTQNHQPQNVADQKFQKSVQKARTVLIYVLVAFGFQTILIVVASICPYNAEICPLPEGPHFYIMMLVFNSVINPIVSIVRTPELRKAIWENIMALHRAIVTKIRGNRVNPQNEQPALDNAPNQQVHVGPACENLAIIEVD